MTLGDKLSRLRKENNYTQEQLADILGVSRQAISKWESDVAYPETDKLIRLSELYNCSLDYLVRDTAQTEATQQAISVSKVGNEKVSKLLSGILRFAPLALYSLWAFLLWAFYAAPLIKLSSNSLYQWYGNSLVYELQPAIKTLISFGVISCAYVAALAVIQRFCNRKANLIANICSFALQIAVFVCALCIIGVCNSCGLEHGQIVVVVSTLTAVFALLQVVFLLLEYYFNNTADEKSEKSETTFFQKVSKWFTAHKVLAIVVACVLFVGSVLSVVLPLTVGNIFTAKRVSRINIGDSRDDVIKVLGEPIDIDFDKLKEYVDDEDFDMLSKENVYYYCTSKAEKLLQNAMRMIDEAEKVHSSDALILSAKLANLFEQLNKIQFKYVEVYFEKGRVEGVEFNSKYSAERENDTKWIANGSSKQRIKLIPDEIPYGETPYSADLYAQIFYADGSYRLSKLENISAVGDDSTGWAVRWSDHWGKYAQRIKQSTDQSNFVERGSWNENISYIINRAHADGMEGYSLKIIANGSSVDGSTAEFDFDAYRKDIVEISVSEGITKLPNAIFKNLTNLTTVDLPKSLTEIGQSAFEGCVRLVSVNVSKGITAIGDRAFYGCSALSDFIIPNSVTAIGDSAFYGCIALDKIAFHDGIESIGAHAFYDCGFTEVNLSSLELSYIGDGAFANCANLTQVNMFIHLYPADNMGVGIFSNSPKLATVDIEYIGYMPAEMFSECKSLTTVNLSGVDNIGDGAFRNCTALTNVNIGLSLNIVGKSAFAGCTSLESIFLPGRVFAVGESAFENCIKLRSVEWECEHWLAEYSVGARAFCGCTALTNVNLSDELFEVGEMAFSKCTSLVTIDLKQTYSIGVQAFSGCSKLTNVTLTTNYWYCVQSGASDGVDISVSSGSDAASKLRGTYCNYNWYGRNGR